MNHYETLGVKRNASQVEIKDAYKALVKKYHPDVYAGDKSFAEKKIKEINAAYDVLSDLLQKQQYDNEIFGNTATYTYTPQNYSYTAQERPYNNSNYSYTTKRRATSNSKYSYENYKKNYKTSGYEYEKRYTDYHRSKTPNSNYTYVNSKINEMHDNITNNITDKFNGLNLKNKALIILAVFILYLIMFISTYIQMDSVLSGKRSGTILNTKETTSSQKNEESETTKNSSTKSSVSRENFDINDYYTDEQLREIYNKGYYTSFETFSEFKDFFEDYIYEYYYYSIY